MASLVVLLSLAHDFAKGTQVKICGSLPELGEWSLDAAPTFTVSENGASLLASVPITKTTAASKDGTHFQFKLAMRRPAESRSGSWQDDRWDWQPGPNRNGILPPAGASSQQGKTGITSSVNMPAPSVGTVVPLRVSWISGRDGTLVIANDPYLEMHREHLRYRYKLFTDALAAIEGLPGGLDAFSRGWEYYGFNHVSEWRGIAVSGIVYREWAPGARALSLIGDFNGWDHGAHPATKDDFGVWSIFVPDRADGCRGIQHGSFVKASLQVGDDPSHGARVMRTPAWVRYATYDKGANEYIGVYWNPPTAEKHVWRHPRARTVHAADYPGSAAGIDRLSAYMDRHRSGAVSAATAPSSASGGVPTSVPVGTTAPTTPASSNTPHLLSPTPVSGADPAPSGLRIYEAHVGMGGEEPRVHTYREFADDVLPRIKAGGYNVVQLMAVMEHAYYGSFGYHVTSFLAPSSRFGTPEDLKYLVDKAHGCGLAIIMDLVHSHASKNVNDGINRWDGTDHHYFHDGARGNHDLWDSRLFDYSKPEVQRFLLSSARLFIEEFRFDGYRFDGVTSMMYHHHGLSFGFSGDYNEYFGPATDLSAVTYLMLANHMLHSCDPPALTIAEDVSGMPTLGRPVWEGGVGFDFRLAMAIPDMWIKYLKETPDDAWDLTKLAHTLTNRRWQEKTIAYAESHDQALVGDKTLAFWLMDKEMYWHMSTAESPTHPVVDRGVALHKMIRLVTYSVGGEAWLNFMGNEFGHPEWVDFPREGNSWSYHHCRRQWHLVDDPLLRYKHMGRWDAAMHALEDAFPWLISRDNFVSLKHDSDKMLVLDRGTRTGPLVFIFNFHPTNSFTGYRVGVPCKGDWVVALDSDWNEFGGYDRNQRDVVLQAADGWWNDRPASVQVYSPCRTVLVLKLRGTPAA